MTGLHQGALRITAHVLARLRKRDTRAELQRLRQQNARRANLEIASVFLALFGFAMLGASFGWIGLGVYFLAVLILFY